METPQLISQLAQILGSDHVITDETELRYFSQDVFSEATPPVLVAQPANIEQLAASVKLTADANYAIIPRGGGASYTLGYVNEIENAVLFDLSRMDKVVEVNLEDMYVTVEAGCRWESLYQVLRETPFTTPMWGTLSGLTATVGGGMSQNAVFFGTGLHGTAADSVIGMEVVLANGDILQTGSGAHKNSLPFLRHFGPDLTNLFTGDNGALGVKGKITLRLIPRLPVHRYASFDFPNYESALSVMAQIAREGLASECFGFDPFLQQQRIKRESLVKDVQTLGKVISSSRSLLGGLKSALEIMLAGRHYMKNVRFSLHVTMPHKNHIGAWQAERRVAKLAKQAGGRKIANSIPKIMHAHPFVPLNTIIGPQGERWVPVHGIVPHSKAQQAIEALEALYEREKPLTDEMQIGIGCLFMSVGPSASLIEPVFFWPDKLFDFHHRHVEKAVLDQLAPAPENKPAYQAIQHLRAAAIEVLAEHGAVHLQLGRLYPYKQVLNEENFTLLQQVKNTLDPHGRMNPGVLGLN